MAAYEFNELKKKYRMFQQPIAVLRMADKDVGGKNGYPISDVEIDLTCGYEASVAGFSLYNVYNKQTDCFEVTDRLKKYIALGAKTEIALGYGSFAELLFVGVVTRVSYRYDADEIPCIRVSAMDVKGVMMAGTYVRQLTAASYSEAVKEILKRSAYAAMLSNGMIRGIQVTDTPDQSVPVPAEGGTVTDRSVEMAAESDYEFVVRAARRYNYEFYTECGVVLFRKAKADKGIRMEISPESGLYHFDISYDVTGLVNKVTVRATDAGKAKVISSKAKNQASLPGKAKALLKGSEKVYIDASADSPEETGYRADALMENISYRYGSLECEVQGLPEYLPGYFVKVSGIGGNADNQFYITRAVHRLSKDGRYTVKLEGRACGENGGSADGII